MSERVEWDSSLSFIFAMIGAAVGLGNIWRFSYVLYSNGGGSFFIPYFTAIAIMGIPFLILEYGVGFSFKESFSKILKDINERFEYIAWMLVLFVFIVVIYYMVILSWDLVYLLTSFTFGWGTDTAAYCNHVLYDTRAACRSIRGIQLHYQKLQYQDGCERRRYLRDH